MAESKKYPSYTGTVQTIEDHVKIGTITLWNELDPLSEKSPLMSGYVVMEVGNGVTQKFKVALWKYTPKE